MFVSTSIYYHCLETGLNKKTRGQIRDFVVTPLPCLNISLGSRTLGYGNIGMGCLLSYHLSHPKIILFLTQSLKVKVKAGKPKRFSEREKRKHKQVQGTKVQNGKQTRIWWLINLQIFTDLILLGG